MTLSPQERGKEMYCDGKGDEMLDEINVDAVAKKYTNVTVMMAVTMAFDNINLDRVSSSSHGRGVGAQTAPEQKQRSIIHLSQYKRKMENQHIVVMQEIYQNPTWQGRQRLRAGTSSPVCKYHNIDNHDTISALQT